MAELRRIINPELETYLPLSLAEIKENPAHLPSGAKAMTASPLFIFVARNSWVRPEMPVPRAAAEADVASQISFIFLIEKFHCTLLHL